MPFIVSSVFTLFFLRGGGAEGGGGGDAELFLGTLVDALRCLSLLSRQLPGSVLILIRQIPSSLSLVRQIAKSFGLIRQIPDIFSLIRQIPDIFFLIRHLLLSASRSSLVRPLLLSAALFYHHLCSIDLKILKLYKGQNHIWSRKNSSDATNLTSMSTARCVNPYLKFVSNL